MANFDPDDPMNERLGMPAGIAAPWDASTSVVPRGIRPIRDYTPTGVPTYNPSENVPATGTAPTINPHVANIQQMEQQGSGVQQVQQKHPFWGGVLKGLDIAGSIAAPGLTARIPGTELHHEALIGQQERLANQDVARQEHEAQTAATQQEVPLREAETERAKAQAEAALREKPEKETLAQLTADRAALADQYGLTGEMKDHYVLTGQMPPALEKPNLQETVEGRTKLAQQYGLTGNEARHYILTGQIPTKFEFPAGAGGGLVGTWSLQEGPGGKPVLFNNKTGEVKPAPAGVLSKAEAKTEATDEALAQSANHALKNMTALAKADDSASNYAFLMNFIGMSYEGVRGARLNRAEIERAAATRSLPDQLQHLYDLYVERKQLTPQQKQEMMGAAQRLEATYHQGGGGGEEMTHFTEGTDSWDIPKDKIQAFQKAHPNAKAQ